MRQIKIGLFDSDLWDECLTVMSYNLRRSFILGMPNELMEIEQAFTDVTQFCHYEN